MSDKLKKKKKGNKDLIIEKLSAYPGGKNATI